MQMIILCDGKQSVVRGNPIRNTIICVSCLSVAALSLAGCKSSGDAASVDAPPRQKVIVTKKRGSGTGPFTRVTIGDSMEKVRTAIGEPSDSRGHFMHKNFNPFYWGSDRYHTIWYYAGKGRVTFNIKKNVMIVENDPSEDGKK